jgi:hypothetical protein
VPPSPSASLRVDDDVTRAGANSDDAVDTIAPSVTLGSIVLRVLPVLILVSIGLALAYGWIDVRGVRSYALGAGSSMQARDGTDVVVDPPVRTPRGLETGIHLNAGSADFMVAGRGRGRFSHGSVRGEDAVVVYTPAARIVASHVVGVSFGVTAESKQTTVTCRQCGKDVRVFSRAEILYVPGDDATIVVPLMFSVR